MLRSYQFFVMTISLLVGISCYAQDRIDIYTASFLPVTVTDIGADVSVVLLDSDKSSLGFFNEQLPSNEKAAIEEFFRLMDTPAGKDAINDLKSNTFSKFEAFSIGIKKIPAIVFDDTYVVYGVFNLSEAVAIYRKKGVKDD